jgi:hypothetical protein
VGEGVMRVAFRRRVG